MRDPGAGEYRSTQEGRDLGLIAIGAYRVRAGMEQPFLDALRQDVEVMRGEGLLSYRPAMILKAGPDVYLEVVEWADETAPARSSENERVMAVWTRKRSLADYITLADVPGSDRLFPSFEEIEGVVD